MRTLIAILGFSLLGACFAPTGHGPTTPSAPVRHVTFGVDPEFPRDFQLWAADTLLHTRLPGVSVGVRVGVDALGAAIPIRRGEFEGCRLAGYWHPVRGEITIDTSCTPGESVWRHVVLHEALHALGALHVCTRPDEDANGECSPVGYGEAVLNPTFQLPGHPGFDSACCDSLPLTEPTALDLAELARVLRTR